jgi:SAM-dependent methyltransferase
MKHSSKNEYWVDPGTGKPRFEFNEMYRDLGDPWGCEDKNQSLTNRIFLEMLVDENSRYQRVIDLGSGKGSLTNLFYNKYIQIRSKYQRNRPTKQTKVTYNFEMIGLEYSEIAVQEAAKIQPKIRFEPFDLINSETIPFNDVDLVILSEVLWYLVSDLFQQFLEKFTIV